MKQHTYKGLQEDPATQLGLARREDLIRAAPTEPEAFLRWAEQRRREEGKFELSRGRVTCNMIHASSLHSRVLRNLVGQLDRLLDPDRFDVGISDFAVRTPYGIRSPDIVVEPARSHTARSTTTPILIVEVLSPSTERVDFTEKLQEYTAVETLETYLICSQDEPRAWVWARQGNGAWPPQPTEMVGRDGSIAPAGLGIELATAAVFRGIPDRPTAS
ncbi:MAG: Uma2 family endonuclease [Hyphomicrobiaceae bacterium]